MPASMNKANQRQMGKSRSAKNHGLKRVRMKSIDIVCKACGKTDSKPAVVVYQKGGVICGCNRQYVKDHGDIHPIITKIGEKQLENGGREDITKSEPSFNVQLLTRFSMDTRLFRPVITKR